MMNDKLDALCRLRAMGSSEEDELKMKLEYNASYEQSLDTSFMDEFFQQVDVLKQNIDKIALDVKQVKQKHAEILVSATTVQEPVKEDLEKLMANISKTANRVRSSIKAMEKEIKEEEKSRPDTCHSADFRIRKNQHSTLSRRFMEVMSDYNSTQAEYREQCKARIQRQLEITGKHKTVEEVEDMLKAGNLQVLTSDILIESSQTQKALGDIQARHKDILRLEKSIMDLHEMFQDMAMLVESQGEMIDRIEYNVQQTVQYVQPATTTLEKAVRYRSKARRCSVLHLFDISAASLTVKIKEAPGRLMEDLHYVHPELQKHGFQPIIACVV